MLKQVYIVSITS